MQWTGGQFAPLFPEADLTQVSAEGRDAAHDQLATLPGNVSILLTAYCLLLTAYFSCVMP